MQTCLQECFVAALDLLGACYRDLQRFEDAEKLFVEEVHFMQRHGFSEEYVSNGIVDDVDVVVVVVVVVVFVWYDSPYPPIISSKA